MPPFHLRTHCGQEGSTFQRTGQDTPPREGPASSPSCLWPSSVAAQGPGVRTGPGCGGCTVRSPPLPSRPRLDRPGLGPSGLKGPACELSSELQYGPMTSFCYSQWKIKTQTNVITLDSSCLSLGLQQRFPHSTSASPVWVHTNILRCHFWPISGETLRHMLPFETGCMQGLGYMAAATGTQQANQ